VILKIITKVILLSTLIQNIGYAQKSNEMYKHLTFEYFIKEKVQNDSIFIADMYRAIGRYPKNPRKNHIEGVVEVLILNHGVNNIELIYSQEACIFNPSRDDIKSACLDNTYNRNEKFFTRFYISYDITPWRVTKEDYHKTFTNLAKNNTFSVLEYPYAELPRH
jgi:hypothetical protein